MSNSLNLGLISTSEQEMINFARLNYSAFEGERIDSICDLDYYLRYWYENKQALYRLFGGQNLILKKKFVEEMSENELNREMSRLMEYSSFGDKYHNFTWSLYYAESTHNAPAKMRRSWLTSDVAAIQEWCNDYRTHLSRLYYMLTTERLASNIYDGEEIILPKEDGTGIFKIPTGMKMIKALARIVKAYPSLGLESGFEDFRLAHSRILNQKIVEGTLCLSIHPLDFITMSDNACDWDSCMSWFNGGDYRAGTVEMMNSPMVVCAYLEAKNDMSYGGQNRWNSKKWRELFIVREENITAIRSYPYYNQQITFECMTWLRELAQENWGCQYMDNLFELRNYGKVEVENMTVHALIECELMYNDFCHNEHWTMVNTKFANDSEIHLEFNYSGPCVCSECGERLDPDDRDYYYGHSSLVCSECSDMVRCACCGTPINIDYAIHLGGNYYCDYCHEENVGYCSACEEPVWLGDGDHVAVDLICQGAWESSAVLCKDCQEQYFPEGLDQIITKNRYGERQIHAENLPRNEDAFKHLLRSVFNASLYKAQALWDACQKEWNADPIEESA